jgi:hypothetical protein
MRKVEVEAGRSVLASLRKKNGVPVDNALIEWAESQNLAVRILLQMSWNSPTTFLPALTEVLGVTLTILERLRIKI